MFEICGLNELAAELNLPREWLRGEAMAGRLPCLRIGRRLLFNSAAVGTALADRAAKERVSSYSASRPLSEAGTAFNRSANSDVQ